jgi:hypothetical protein
MMRDQESIEIILPNADRALKAIAPSKTTIRLASPLVERRKRQR